MSSDAGCVPVADPNCSTVVPTRFPRVLPVPQVVVFADDFEPTVAGGPIPMYDTATTGPGAWRIRNYDLSTDDTARNTVSGTTIWYGGVGGSRRASTSTTVHRSVPYIFLRRVATYLELQLLPRAHLELSTADYLRSRLSAPRIVFLQPCSDNDDRSGRRPGQPERLAANDTDPHRPAAGTASTVDAGSTT